MRGMVAINRSRSDHLVPERIWQELRRGADRGPNPALSGSHCAGAARMARLVSGNRRPSTAVANIAVDDPEVGSGISFLSRSTSALRLERRATIRLPTPSALRRLIWAEAR